MSRRAATVRALLVALGVLAADQATKALVRAQVPRGGEEAVLPFLTLVNTRNSGIAFGLLQDAGPLLVIVALAALLGILAIFAYNAGRPRIWIAMGLLLGGALGNLLDRAVEGAVTDFIDLPAWPAFNLADVAITVGVVAMVWLLEGPRARSR